MSLRDKIKATLATCSTLEEMIDILHTATASDDVAEELFEQRIAHFWWEPPKTRETMREVLKHSSERLQRRKQMSALPLDEIRKKAATGDPDAMFVLGTILLTPWNFGIRFRDRREDEKRGEMAKKYMQERDEFYKKSEQEGEKWLLKAAKDGDVDAQKSIALTFKGKVDKDIKREDLKNDADHKQALYWIRQAAIQGDLKAQDMYKDWQERALEARDFIGEITIDNIAMPVTFNYPDFNIKEEVVEEGLDTYRIRVGGKVYSPSDLMEIIRKMLEAFDSVYTDKSNKLWIVSTKYGIIAALEKKEDCLDVASVSPLTGSATKNLKKVDNAKIYHRDL